MKVTYLGTTVLLFDDGKEQVMFDCQFSRPSLFKFAFGKFESNHNIVDDLINKYKIDRLKAIFISHSHYDHVLDAPYMVKKTNADLYGSLSTLNIARGENIAEEKLYCYDNSMEYKIGSFDIKIIPSRHSKPNLFNNDLGQIIDKPFSGLASRKCYKEGGSFDFVVKHKNKTYLIRPSFNYIENQLNDIKADVLFLSIGAMSKSDMNFRNKFYQETIEKVQPQLVIPIHWDNFFKPLNQKSYFLPKILEDSEDGLYSLGSYCGNNNITCIILPPLNSIDL